MRKHSFTLIELLIVLVIIGILAMLAIPKFELLIIKAKGAEAMVNVAALADAVWRYYLEAGRFPAQGTAELLGVPLDLDITLPKSGNFVYEYQNLPNSTGPWMAGHYATQDNSSIPDKAIVVYVIFYIRDIPVNMGMPGQKMDEHWYKHYYHSINNISGDNPGQEDKPGWP